MPFPSVVRCAIFDLDGTLLDSLEDLADSGNAMLQSRGFPMHETARYRQFVGDGARTLVQRLLPSACQKDQALIDACLASYTREYATRWHCKTHPYPGIPLLLEELAARDIALAVLSNKGHNFTLQCVNQLCPAPAGCQWAAIHGLRDGARPKPDPSGVLQILNELQVLPEETLYLGDTNTDMRTALAAGVFPIGVLWGFRPREELQQAGAAILLARPCELLPLLPHRA